jgi:hypothetical protein
MAAWREALEEVGGFDPQFRAAGDDVDLCWRLQESGHSIGFSPAALVWHHRRRSIRSYWRQQKGYGRAEALVERKWPEKYNRAGHLRWAGRIYGTGAVWPLSRRKRVFHGTWGTALFQRMYEPRPGTVASMPLMPEWYLVMGILAGLSIAGIAWPPLLAAVPALVLATVALVAQALVSASHASYDTTTSRARRAEMRGVTTALYLIQPLARLFGRLGQGLTPWRHSKASRWILPRPRVVTIWSGEWQALGDRLAGIEAEMTGRGAAVQRGGEFDRWGVEEHGEGRQAVLIRSWPRIFGLGVAGSVLLFGAAVALAIAGEMAAAGVAATATALTAGRIVYECGIATGLISQAVSGD